MMLTKKAVRVLLIEDEQFDVDRVKNTLAPFKDEIEIVNVVSDGVSAIELLRSSPDFCDVIIMDYQIAGGLMGDVLISRLREGVLPPQIIVVTKMSLSASDFSFAANLIKAGAFWYCTKYPIDIEEHIYQPTDFVLGILNAFKKRELERGKLKSDSRLMKNIAERLKDKEIVGASQAIVNMTNEVLKYARTSANILITGESGTGKELVAANIHYNSDRKFENFVPINCGSIPADLLESELFGYQKGAFTGANADKPGLFELADHGTIFLDEVAELPLSSQVKLLRVIQDGELEKIGRTQVNKVDVRVIAATNKDLKAEVREKRFREDLYYRLNVVPMRIPPLRDRKDDIPILLEHFLGLFADEMNRAKPEVTAEAIKELVDYDWPGNVRELQNFVQRILVNDFSVVTAASVHASIGITPEINENGHLKPENFFSDGSIRPLREAQEAFMREYVLFVRKQSTSDADAARKLGLLPSNYSRMLRTLKIK